MIDVGVEAVSLDDGLTVVEPAVTAEPVVPCRGRMGPAETRQALAIIPAHRNSIVRMFADESMGSAGTSRRASIPPFTRTQPARWTKLSTSFIPLCTDLRPIRGSTWQLRSSACPACQVQRRVRTASNRYPAMQVAGTAAVDLKSLYIW